MTYCVAMVLNEGLVFASDSRTNAGVDHVSTFCKMTVFETPGEGVLVMLNSGNLATTQQVISKVKQHAKDQDTPLTSMGSVFNVAELVGRQFTSIKRSDSFNIIFVGTFINIF